MNNSWADLVKEKIDSYIKNKIEIERALNDLLSILSKSPYNLYTKCDLIDKKNLIWEIQIGFQEFCINVQEILKAQIVEGLDKYGDRLIVKKISIEEALQKLILEKLK